MKDRLKVFVQKYMKPLLAFSIFFVAILITFLGYSLAALTPVESIIITSENISYASKEAGSWQVEKSGKWISKGKARITFDVDTIEMTNYSYTDVIFVLDTSGSMEGSKLERVKQDTSELLNSLLSNSKNQAALITFDSASNIVSELTNNKDTLLTEIDNLKATGSTNYYQALVNVDNVLKDYQKESNREVIVLFLTDGYPNNDSPNQVAQYQYLKSEYPYMTVNAIQYEMGDSVLEQIKEISDNQFLADMDNLNNVLFDASVVSTIYDKFQIVDYVDDRYFTLDGIEDITVSDGEVALEEENGKQKITWTIDSFSSGRDAKLTMDVFLKEDYIGESGVYSTNDSEQVISKIANQEENVTSTKTPVLADNFRVIYEGNAPNNSTVSNVPAASYYSVFDTVSITEEEPTCSGYQFDGWEIVTKNVTEVGDGYFIMPVKDVVIRARWSKLGVSKSMDGTVNTMGPSIINSGPKWWKATTIDKNQVTSIVTKDNLDIPATVIESWDASEAGDMSVIAYVESDGDGYRLTIAGQDEIIANSNSLQAFCDFTNALSIQLTYLDTSEVTTMNSMFHGCSSLTSLDLSNFNTSQVTKMSSMFRGCTNLTNLNLRSFNTSQVTDMSSMFGSCESLTDLQLIYFDTSKVEGMTSMFYRCSSLTSLDLGNFNTTKVKFMTSMFEGCSSLTSLIVDGFNTSNVVNMGYMFTDCSKLISLDLRNFDTSNVTTMHFMFDGCRSLTTIYQNFNTYQVTSMIAMFRNCRSLVSLDVNNFNTVNVTTMSYMFYHCDTLSSLDLSNFNTSYVEDMQWMFSDCSSLTSLDLSNFNTYNVTTMADMFQRCSSLTSLDVSSFDTSNVTSMRMMFASCSRLTNLDLSNFDTKNVSDMDGMVTGCNRLTNLDMRKAEFGSVTSYDSMFSSANVSLRVTVKNSTASSWIRSRLDEEKLYGATVVIA